MSKSNLFNLNASELIEGYRQKQWTAVEVTESVLGHIKSCEPHLQATFLFDEERAMLAAKKADARLQSGLPVGLLEGVPVTIKENIATVGQVLPSGTAAVIPVVALKDAPPAARLKEAGTIMVTKTTMPDFGMLTSGLSSFHSIARNPWDIRCTPGGSSAGAGSAAAAGYGPLHLGTDIGGSVRLPANFCGLVGLKPSLGRIPIDPPYIGRCAGPMTRTVADTALMMQVLAQPDEADSMGLPGQSIDWLSVAKLTNSQAPELLKGLKIGLLLDAQVGMATDPRIRQIVEQAAKALSDAGAVIEPIAPFLTETMLHGLDLFWRMRSLVDLDNLPTEQREKCLPFIRQWAEGARNASGRDIFNASQQSYMTRVATVQATRPFDFILSPVAPCLPFAATNPSPAGIPDQALEHIAYTVPFNMSEQPAVSVNFGYATNENGRAMPIGIQIAGHRFDDLGVLRVARAIEAIRPAQLPWPADYRQFN